MDSKELARAICLERSVVKSPNGNLALLALACNLAIRFKSKNPAFNVAEFLTLCGY